ncbi:Hypp7305 [Branchiostoma lanceolatum]|uniref:Hypp7305 protein n=1 Tax=Branchiostoma lanceolatum TaxID=7740 RepID=A0A8K0EAR9_BRALA|nr:Hypp7305 [Branchiostoma lanceolatum]
MSLFGLRVQKAVLVLPDRRVTWARSVPVATPVLSDKKVTAATLVHPSGDRRVTLAPLVPRDRRVIVVNLSGDRRVTWVQSAPGVTVACLAHRDRRVIAVSPVLLHRHTSVDVKLDL